MFPFPLPSLALLQEPTPLLAGLSALLSLVIAAVVLNRNPHRVENQAFFALVSLAVLVNLNAASLFFGVNVAPIRLPQYRLLLALGGVAFFPLVLFAHAFPFNRRPSRLLFWGGLGIVLGHFVSSLWFFESEIALTLSRVGLGALLLVALWSTVRNYRQLERREERLGLLLIHGVLASRLVVSGLAFALPRTGRPPDFLLLVFQLIVAPPAFAAILAYGLIRFQLFDPRRLLSRSLSLFLVSSLSLGIFIGLVTLVQGWLSTLLGFQQNSLVLTTVALSVLLTVFHPVRLRVEQALERRFNPELVQAREATRAYTLKTRSMLPQQALYEALQETVRKIAPNNHLALLMRHPSLHLRTRDGLTRFMPGRPLTQASLQRDPVTGEESRPWPEAGPLLELLRQTGRSHLMRRSRQGLPPEMRKAAEGLYFTLAIPIWQEEDVTGLMLLDGEEIDRERVHMLQELAGYLGLQWENALLYAQTLASNEALTRTNKDLEDTRLFLESLFESVPAGIAVLDSKANVVRWNRTMERLTGISREEALHHPDLNALVPDLASAFMGGDATRQGFTAPLKRRLQLENAGRDVIVHMRLALFRDRQGGTGGTVLILTDVTEQVTMQTALEEARRLAALGQFAAAMAHELRTPLTSIQMNIQILSGKIEVAPEDAEYFDIVLTELDRLNKTISEILDYAKPMRLQHTLLELSELVEEVVRSLYFLLAERGTEVEVAVPDKLLVQMDAERMKQVLINLLDNASQAMQEDPARREGGARADEPALIRITAQTAPGPSGLSGIELRLADRGRGISKDTVAHIFEPFYTTRARGTGLGLAVAKKIMDAHQGQIRVESQEGEGTTFSLWWPSNRVA